jgi:pimeloyl-ACP methyl ester carboxylesterase
MVSTGMQGGCVCENCSYLRVNTGNVEIAGMFAPKPLAMSAANDWTKELMTKGYPELKELYKLYGAEDKVAAKAWLEYGHQYNQHAREFMYSWFVKHLKGKDEVVKEAAYKPTPVKELSVFDAEHPRPKDELNAEKLREAMAKASDEQMAKLAPKDAASLKEFRRIAGTALRVMVNDRLPTAVDVREGPHETKTDGITLYRAVLGRTPGQDAIPSVGLMGPKSATGPVVIWVHPKGKASLVEDGKIVPPARKLIDAGCSILAPDVFGVGELTPDKPQPVDKGFAGFTYGYNRSLLANRVHDVLTLLGYGCFSLRVKGVHLVGWGEMGPVAILARAIAGDKVARTAADMNQFRFENVKDTADPMMLPGAVKYGGLPAFLALCAPGEVLAHNHAGTSSGKLSKAAYDAAGAPDKLTRVNEKMDDIKVVEWLLK